MTGHVECVVRWKENTLMKPCGTRFHWHLEENVYTHGHNEKIGIDDL
jgi:hypothetical protein